MVWRETRAIRQAMPSVWQKESKEPEPGGNSNQMRIKLFRPLVALAHTPVDVDDVDVWLVVWNMIFLFFHNIGNSNPNRRAHIFQRGWTTRCESLDSFSWDETAKLRQGGDAGSNKGKQPSIMEVSPTPRGKTWYWGSILNTELWVDEHSFFSSILFLLLSFTCSQNRWSGKGFFQRNFWEIRIQHDDMWYVHDCRSKGPCRHWPLQRPPGFQHETLREFFSEFGKVFFLGERFSEIF